MHSPRVILPWLLISNPTLGFWRRQLGAKKGQWKTVRKQWKFVCVTRTGTVSRVVASCGESSLILNYANSSKIQSFTLKNPNQAQFQQQPHEKLPSILQVSNSSTTNQRIGYRPRLTHCGTNPKYNIYTADRVSTQAHSLWPESLAQSKSLGTYTHRIG